jgi:hypothetical protein
MAETSAAYSLETFFLKTPLYDEIGMTGAQLRIFFGKGFKVDGFCPFCKKPTTFERDGGYISVSANDVDDVILKHRRFGSMTLQCARSENHRVIFEYYLNEGKIQKIGQYPSFADIAIDESKDYSKLLDKDDSAEFHKALGLAAHGIGIGSYVYLRRIFERLIWKRFDEHKEIEGWNEEEFKKLRMKEKIEHLKGHLPEFLVKNAKLYSILSLGVHELTEKDCLAFFPVLRQSTIWILEQDKKKQQELAQQKALEAAITKFSPSGQQ